MPCHWLPMSSWIVKFVFLTCKINKSQIKVLFSYESPRFVMFKTNLAIVIRFIRKMDDFYIPECTFSSFAGDIYGFNALDASSNISPAHKGRKPHHKINHIILQVATMKEAITHTKTFPSLCSSSSSCCSSVCMQFSCLTH